jgi:predicted histone-like DNA-binding protein
MAVHIRLVKNNIKNNNSYGKYFAKAVSQGEVAMKELAEEAALNSGISRANFIRGVAELQDMMKHRLANGKTVVIEGIGRFSLRVESIGVDDPKQFNISRHITRFVCKFLPTGKRINIGHGTKNGQILYDFSKDVKAVWQHGFKP